MQTSESIMKISPAILAAQRSIKFAAKDATNLHFKNKYADLSSVVEAVKDALNNEGIAFIQSGSPATDGCLHLTTRLLHESGEWLQDTLVMPLPKQDPQGYGSAMTYARRYALAAITGLYQDDDDGNQGSGVGDKAAKPAARSSANKAAAESAEPEGAALAMLEQLKSAATVPELVKIMNDLPKELKGSLNATFNERMKELKKAA